MIWESISIPERVGGHGRKDLTVNREEYSHTENLGKFRLLLRVSGMIQRSSGEVRPNKNTRYQAYYNIENEVDSSDPWQMNGWNGSPSVE
jgi:hypothetical protein